VTTGVYILIDHNWTVRYVGSVDRSSPALNGRLRTHLRHGKTLRSTWNGVGLVRIPNGLPHKTVLLCEGWIGRVLDPLDNDRLPTGSQLAVDPAPAGGMTATK
jgi:hypothetical protein